MFGRWLKTASQNDAPGGAEQLAQVVREELPDADETTTLVVTAIAGLLGTVAYADREFKASEQERIRRELSRVSGMTEQGITAICHALERHIVEVSTVETPRYSRLLLELADRELRLEILEVMLDIAAADGTIGNVETNVLRQVTKALGLTQDDYNDLQDKHRARLAVLSGSAPK
jgi:uncharacterized tellurite resistance protein B-like protein